MNAATTADRAVGLYMIAGVRGFWPLVGRVEELQRVDRVLRGAGDPGGVVLAGATGVGKTRLAREAGGAAARRGSVVRWATATAAAGQVPLGAFTVLGVPGASGGAGVDGARGISVMGGEDPAGLAGRILDALTAQEGGGRAVVLGVDDAHLLDEMSALLLYQVVSRQQARVILTVRNGEPAPEPVTALWKEGYLERLELLALNEAETAALLEAGLGGCVDSATAHRMWALSSGNALYLRHLVDGEREADRLRERDGVWRWSGQAQLSQGLRQLVGVQMGELSESMCEVVDLLALGEPLEVTILERLASRDALEDVEERGLATVERNGRRLHARLAHPLYGETRRTTIGVLRARRLRGHLAAALTDTGARRGDDTLRKALLLLDSDLKLDPQLLVAAARSASQRGDLHLAERLARAAVDEGGGFDSRLQLAYTLTWLDRGDDADRELTILADLAADDTERSLAAFPRAGNLFFILRRPQEAQAVLVQTEQRVRDEAARLTLTSLQAAFQVWLGHPHDAVRTAREALARAVLPDESVILATWGLVAGLGVLGRFEEARPLLARGYDAAARIGDGPLLGLGLQDLHILALRLAGHVREAEQLARAEYEDHRDGFGMSQVMRVTLLGHTALARGKVRTAVRWLREARAGYTENSDLGGWGYRCLMSLTQALTLAGETAAARQSLAELETYRHPGFVLFEPEIVLASAWVAAVEGAVSEAVRMLRTSAATHRRQGQFAWEVQALHTAVRFGDRGVSARLGGLVGRVDGPRARAAADHAAAFAANDGDALRAAGDRLAELGDLAAAVDAAAQAAAVYTRGDQRGSALAAAAQARRLAEEAEGVRTPALIAIDRPLPLTGREREVVTLAVHGLSNQRIADRLGVSVRTVEGHLYRAGARLGVSGRTELATVLGV